MCSEIHHKEPQLKITGDGSHTLYIEEMNEHYHSYFGALTESKHIFIEAGFNFSHKENLSVFEAGFGTGLNAFLTALAAGRQNIKVIYTSIDKYPLPAEITSELNYSEAAGLEDNTLFASIHNAGWGKSVVISPWFTLKKIKTDLVNNAISGIYDLIYFDAFGPDKQPEMWSREVMEKIAGITHQGSVFVTYSAKGNLKRMLKELGFEVTLLPGPPGKRVITRAIKK